MAAAHYAAHQQQHRYNSTSDVTLPPITSLNFPGHSQRPNPPTPSSDSESAVGHNAYRSRQQWPPRLPHTYSNNSSSATSSQHHHPQQLQTPPLSAGPDHSSSKVGEYSRIPHHSKQDENNTYSTSALVPPPGSSSLTPGSDDARQRTLSNGPSVASVHTSQTQNTSVGYSYHASQSNVSQAPSLYHASPPPSIQEQMHRSSVQATPNQQYPGYIQQPYLSNQRNSQAQNQSSPTHPISYQSPVLPAHSDRWEPSQHVVNHLPPAQHLQQAHTPPQPQPPQSQEPPIPVQVTTSIPPAQSHISPAHHSDHRSSYLRNNTLPPASRMQPQQASSYSNKAEVTSPKQDTMSQIVELCSLLYDFASRFAQLQANRPEVRPTPTELTQMVRRAHEVVRLLEELHRRYLPESERTSSGDNGASKDNRPPKRPWEDMAKGGVGEDFGSHEIYGGSKAQEDMQADRDMDEIRMKRANSSTTVNGNSNQLKSKYRKRSRASPPGKCHSCNIRETPEWRRGPDGARTLCNACGLHYAKLVRKKMQHQPPGAPPPRIDMETLRASARAADLEKSARAGAKAMGQGVHQGTFQVVPMSSTTALQTAGQTPSLASTTSPPSESGHGATSNSIQSPNASMHQNHVPWQSSPQQHQSFLRTPQHNTSAR